MINDIGMTLPFWFMLNTQFIKVLKRRSLGIHINKIHIGQNNRTRSRQHSLVQELSPDKEAACRQRYQ